MHQETTHCLLNFKLQHIQPRALEFFLSLQLLRGFYFLGLPLRKFDVDEHGPVLGRDAVVRNHNFSAIFSSYANLRFGIILAFNFPLGLLVAIIYWSGGSGLEKGAYFIFLLLFIHYYLGILVSYRPPRTAKVFFDSLQFTIHPILFFLLHFFVHSQFQPVCRFFQGRKLVSARSKNTPGISQNRVCESAHVIILKWRSRDTKIWDQYDLKLTCQLMEGKFILPLIMCRN